MVAAAATAAPASAAAVTAVAPVAAAPAAAVPAAAAMGCTTAIRAVTTAAAGGRFGDNRQLGTRSPYSHEDIVQYRSRIGAAAFLDGVFERGKRLAAHQPTRAALVRSSNCPRPGIPGPARPNRPAPALQ